MRLSLPKLAVLTIGLMTIPFLLWQSNPEAKATRRVVKAVQDADAPMHRAGGLPEVEQFAAELKAIDTTGAPPAVRQALSNYILMVERNIQVRLAKGDTNAANDEVAEAKRAFIRAADKHTGAIY